MTGFVLHLSDSARSERFENVTSFVGEDASGSFALWPRHHRLVTCLTFGLARFRVGDGPWSHLALPGAVLRFAGGELIIGTRRYLVDADLDRVSAALQEELLSEEEELSAVKDSLRRMEEGMLKRLWRLKRGGEGA